MPERLLATRDELEQLLVQLGHAHDREQRRDRRHRMWCRLGDHYESAKQIAAVVFGPLVCIGVLVAAVWTIGEAGTRWLAVPIGTAVAVVAYVGWRMARRRGGARQ